MEASRKVSMSLGVELSKPPDNTSLLMSRIDTLESLITTTSQSQPELMRRMTNLETLVEKVTETQKLLIERMPPPDLLVRLNQQLVPVQPAFGQVPNASSPSSYLERRAGATERSAQEPQTSRV